MAPGGGDAAGPGGASRSASLGPGSPGAGPASPEYLAYVEALRRRVEGRLAYPAVARRRGLEGTVEVEIRIDAAGRLAGLEVLAAPADSLRAAAVRAIEGALPLPPPPGGAPVLVVRLPVRFKLADAR